MASVVQLVHVGESAAQNPCLSQLMPICSNRPLRRRKRFWAMTGCWSASAPSSIQNSSESPLLHEVVPMAYAEMPPAVVYSAKSLPVLPPIRQTTRSLPAAGAATPPQGPVPPPCIAADAGDDIASETTRSPG